MKRGTDGKRVVNVCAAVVTGRLETVRVARMVVVAGAQPP